MATATPHMNTITGYMPMSKFRPSKYIMHSGYATVKTYPSMTTTVTIPNSVTVSSGDKTYSDTITLPTTSGIGWRSMVTNETDGFGISTPNFLIPCTMTVSGSSFDTFIYGEVIRNTKTTIQLKIVFTGVSGGATYSGMGNTYTLKIQPYISPFES